LKVLLDEMYGRSHGDALRRAGIEARTAAELGLSGRSDADLLEVALADGFTLVTENVADFARISAEHVLAGGHHPGILIALSSRVSRRPDGVSALVAAIRAVAGEQVRDRTVYLRRVDPA
jgi:predicted nuclease of predicted toxin-antitoxin system